MHEDFMERAPLHLQLYNLKRDWINEHVSHPGKQSIVVCSHLDPASIAASWVVCKHLPTDILEYSMFAVWVTDPKNVVGSTIHSLWKYMVGRDSKTQYGFCLCKLARHVDTIIIDKRSVQLRACNRWQNFPRPPS